MRPGEPWSRENDHAMLARRFAERFTSDERVLCAIELHDEQHQLNRAHQALLEATAQVRSLMYSDPDSQLPRYQAIEKAALEKAAQALRALNAKREGRDPQ